MKFNFSFHKALSGRRRKGGASANQNKPLNELKKVKPSSGYATEVEKNFEKALKDYQKNGKVTISESDLLELENKLQEMTNSDEIRVGIRFSPYHLKEILNDGRFKSQFETGTSGGALNNYFRSQVEKEQMGYKKKLNPEDRPIYGMLFEGKNSSEIKPSKSEGGFYGSAVAIFKPSVKAHTTVTFDDSLNNFKTKQVYPSPLLAPKRYSIEAETFGIGSMYSELSRVRANGGKMRLENVVSPFTYAEVQIHNRQATVSNIERIIFPKSFSKDDIPVDFLRKQGIKWNIEK